MRRKLLVIGIGTLLTLGLIACGSVDDTIDKSKEILDIETEEDTKDEAEFSEDDLEGLNEAYLEIIDEYGEELIIKIEPKTDDYKEINIMLNEALYNSFDDNEKQMFIDDVGNKVENNTRSRLYQTPSSEFLNVYFVNDKFESLAKTGHFDRGWKVK